MRDWSLRWHEVRYSSLHYRYPLADTVSRKSQLSESHSAFRAQPRTVAAIPIQKLPPHRLTGDATPRLRSLALGHWGGRQTFTGRW